MTRTRASARKAGTSFETLIAGYLAATVDDRIERRTRNGSKDRGFLGDLVGPLDARLSISKLLPLFVAEWGVQVGHSPTHRAHRSRSAGRTAGNLAVAGIRGPLDLGSDQGASLLAVEVASHHVQRQRKIMSFVVIGNLADVAR